MGEAVQAGATEPQDDLLFESAGGIARVTFNRPQARNALTFAMYERLAAICAEIDADATTRVLVITGAGDKAFAAGTDIAQFRAFRTPEDAIGYERRIDRVLGALERVRVPTIAAVRGACTGGGCGIAACCDLRVAAPGARFGFPIARTLGNTLSMANYARLASLVGMGRARDLILTARLLDAPEALAAGFVTELVADAADLPARVDALAATLAGNAPLTLAAAKQAMLRIREAMTPPEAEELILQCYMSEDFREGMEAFLGKRPPVWRGK